MKKRIGRVIWVWSICAITYSGNPSTLWSAPPITANRSNGIGLVAETAASRELREQLSTLKREIRNQDEEVATVRERLGTIDQQIEALQSEQQEELAALKDQLKSLQRQSDERIAALEKSIQLLLTDLKQLHEFSQKQVAAYEQQRERVQSLEQALVVQQRNQEQLQYASQKLADAMTATLRSDAESSPGKPAGAASLGLGSYQVQPGDRLEKIARRHHTTVQQLKELNQLTTDRILVGQILKVPEPAP